MSDLADLVPSLQRAVAPPGQFATLYPDAGSNDLVGLLADGLAESVLDRFFYGIDISWTDEGIVTPDLTRGQQALVVIYAATTFVRAELKNSTTTTRYKAGPVEYETQSGASVISQILKDLAARKDELITQQALSGASSAFIMADSYLANAIGALWFDPIYEFPYAPQILG